MATKQELIDKLDTIDSTMGRIASETQGLISEVDQLKQAAQQAGDNVPPEIAERIERIGTKATTVDDLVKNIPNVGSGSEAGGTGEGNGENPQPV